MILGRRASVSFIPRSAIPRLDKPTHVISFVDRYETEPEWSVDPKSLCRITQLNAQTILQLLRYLSLVTGDVVVHCEYGQVRSATVAFWMNQYLGYDLDLNHPGCYGKLDRVDPGLFNMLIEFTEEYNSRPSFPSQEVF